jgi:arylsulfatase A-like enzyme
MMKTSVVARLASVVIATGAACGGGSGVSPGAPTATPRAAAAAWAPVDAGPPNVIVILADDLGWGDLGSYGNASVRTPNLDRMAAEGVRFTSFYVPSPICAPSRAGLLTGRWPPRTGISWNPPDRLHADEALVSQSLQDRGYATGMAGKWHLGWRQEDMPIHWGFDFFYGTPNGDDENLFVLGDRPTRDSAPPELASHRYTQEAISFISSRRDRPFFFYLSLRDPHLPYCPPPPFAGRSAGGTYGDVLEQLDATIGLLQQALVDLGLDENTLVVFLSDNGPVRPPQGGGSAGPFSGQKGSCEEGGIRVPGIMRWPARIRPGRVEAEPVSSLDLYPTIVALTGAALPSRRLDGQDISPLLFEQVSRLTGPGLDGGRELLFWQAWGLPGALRSGSWKLLRPGPWSPTVGLYNLADDPGEQHDLSAARPDLVNQLSVRLDQIRAGY